MTTKNSRRLLRARLHRASGGWCCYCGTMTTLEIPESLGVPLPGNFATIEHLRRLSDGGTDHADNLALSCFACNTSRGDMSWVEFKTLKAPAQAA